MEDATPVDERGLTGGEPDVGGLSKVSGWRVVEEDMDEPSRASDVRDESDVVLEDGE